MGHFGTRRARHGQRGMTFLGVLILVAFVGLFVFAGLKLAPIYLEYMNVAKALQALPTEQAGSDPRGIRLALQKRFDIDDVQSIRTDDIEVTRQGSNWVVRAAWERTTPFVGNVGFIVAFDRSVEVPTS
jgi:hypothetical protein